MVKWRLKNYKELDHGEWKNGLASPLRLNLVNKINSEDATWTLLLEENGIAKWRGIVSEDRSVEAVLGGTKKRKVLTGRRATLHCCTAIRLVISTQMTCLLPKYLSVLNQQTLISWKLLGKAALARWAFIPVSYGGARMLAGFSCTVTGGLARGSRSGVTLGWSINCSVGSPLLLLCGPAIFSLVQLLAASATCWD